MTKNRFYRIIKEVKNGSVENSKDRKDLVKLIDEFSKKEDVFKYFVRFRGKEAIVNDEEIFERFIEENLACKFEDFGEVESKKELAEIFKDTKAKNLHTSDITIIHRKREKLPQIFYDDFEPEISGRVVVVENYESFLRVDFKFQKLNLKQRYIEDKVSKINNVYKLIKKHAAVVEQEVLNKC